MPKVNGQKGAFPQPSHFGRSEAGAYTVKIWEGTLSEIYQIAVACEQSGGLWEITESFTGAKHKIEARFPIDFNTTEAPVNGWELFGEEVEKDVLESNIADIDALSDKDKVILRALLDKGTDPAFPDERDEVTAGFARNLYDQIILGLKSKRQTVYHLRHTQTTSILYPINASLANVDRILSTGTLLASETIPSSLPLAVGISNRAGMAFGWYKKFPTIREATGHRTQIEQEWEYGLWSTIVYGSIL